MGKKCALYTGKYGILMTSSCNNFLITYDDMLWHLGMLGRARGKDKNNNLIHLRQTVAK